MATYLRLFDPTQQFQLKNGALNVSGRLYVYLEGTDDFADLYDENGSQLQQPVVLDNNGRSAGLFVDSKKTYWMKVNDQYDGTIFTIRKMTPCGGGGGSVLSGTYNVISSDQSVNIEKSVDAGNTTFDLSVSDDGNDLLEWIRCDGDSAIRCTDIRKPVYTEGTMEVGYQGIKLIRGHYYHVTAHVRATKNAEREPWYDTIRMYFSLYYGQNNIVDVTSQSQIIDYSLGLTQEYEISTDVIPEFDCELLFQIAGQDLLTGGDVELVDIEAHRIYSGSPSIPSGVLSRPQAAEIYQPLLTAGDNIYIDTTTWTISAAGGGGGGGSIYNSGDGTIVHNTGNHEIDLDWTKAQYKLVAGDNISIDPTTHVISAVGGKTYTSGTGIFVDNVNDTISLDGDVVIDNDYHHTDNNFTDGDKTKLDGIQAGAEQNVQSDWLEQNSNSDAYIRNKPDLSHYVTDVDLSGKADKVEGAVAGNLAGLDATGNLTDSGVSALNIVHDPDYVHTDYNFTYIYKNKIDGIQAGAEPNVQSDWLEENPDSDAYIKNKPNIPSAFDTKELVAGLGITLTPINNVIEIDTAVPGVVVGYRTL